MNGPIAQAVALTCHANGALVGVSSGSFLDTNTTAQFCERVSFGLLHKGLFGRSRESLCAATPDEWFNWLNQRGTKAVTLGWQPTVNARFPDRVSAGFIGGGGTWHIDALDQRDGVTRWSADWQVWNQDAPHKRIWRVSYIGVPATTPRGLTSGLRDAARELEEALVQIHSFAELLGTWSDSFSVALETLRAGVPRGYHRDLAPAGVLNHQAINLLDAAQVAWVFGGMGSWNDVGFPPANKAEYERVSEALFQALTGAIVAAANSSASAARLGA